MDIVDILSRWDKKEFPSVDQDENNPPKLDWCTIGKVSGHDNLFAFVDYFLSQNVSEAETEQGFSVMKETKTARRAVHSNVYLENQLRVILPDTTISTFNYDGPIDIWMGFKKYRRGLQYD